MSYRECPNEAELLSFADADLSPEQLERIERHLEDCGACAKQVAALRQLLADVAAPLPQPPLDIAEHVATVMGRLDRPVRAPRVSRWAVWGGGVAAAAALVLAVFARAEAPLTAGGEFMARGGPVTPALSRDLGIQLYSQEQVLRPLPAGSRVTPGVALTAGLRNLASKRAYLLLFAVDSHKVVHWIAPQFTEAGSNPEATPVVPSKTEQLLGTAVVFDDLAPGPLRVVALLSEAAMHVSDVEALPPDMLSAESLMKRFPAGEVRQFLLEVQPQP